MTGRRVVRMIVSRRTALNITTGQFPLAQLDGEY